MTALICGSIAYDTIMVFKDRFRNHILPDKVHLLSVSFLVPEMRKEFGGCAGNIAYNLSLLGGDGLPMGTVGKDFGRYGRWMDSQGINRRHVSMIETEFTAQAFITTDLDDNQITAFHPGAMDYSHLNDVRDTDGVRIGTVSPDGRDGMIQHASQFQEAGIPFIFDPSQGLPMFDGDDLRRFIEQADWVTANDYEWELIAERTGYGIPDVVERTRGLIVTHGARGSAIHTRKGTVEIPAAMASQTVDPTGCGDAFRAGLLYGLLNDMDWETTGRIASLMGAINVESHGTQNHAFERAEFEARFEECFGRSVGW
jgi:adenosine kinase